MRLRPTPRFVALVPCAVLVLACGTHEQRSESRSAGSGPTVEEPAGDPVAAPDPPEPTEAGETPPTCAERIAEVEARFAAIAERHSACRYDVECIETAITAPCFSPCGLPMHPRGASEVAALASEIETTVCPTWEPDGCAKRVRCERWLASCQQGRCVAAGPPSADDVPAPVPASNAADLDEPPPRPPLGSAEERARRLFDAIVHDDPSRARDFFFPREAFLRVKAIADPGGYWDRLYARYEHDIHALHESTPDLARAQFDRLELVRRGGWVRVREEGNAIPYWVSRHSWLHYTVDGAPRKLEVRVLITWGDEWWITHLSEFR